MPLDRQTCTLHLWDEDLLREEMAAEAKKSPHMRVRVEKAHVLPDNKGKRRNSPYGNLCEKTFDALRARNKATAPEIAAEIGVPISSASSYLQWLVKRGDAKRVTAARVRPAIYRAVL